MKGQLSLFDSGFIKDADCTKDTPVVYGVPDKPVYGTGHMIKPRIPGRTDTDHMKRIFLPELFPLEEYDLVAVLLSGGKDSTAMLLLMIERDMPIDLVLSADTDMEFQKMYEQ